ncbi:MAG: neutral zinc metallopeptidase [bacterium]
MARRIGPFLFGFLLLMSWAVLAASCGGGDDDDDTSSTSKDRDRDGIRDARDKCPRDKEDEGRWGSDAKDGCPATVDDLIELARSDIDTFWQNEFDIDGVVYDGPIKFEPYTTEIETDCGRASLNNAFYCSADHSIYYDSNFLTEQLNSNGDFAPVLIVAHEWGHLVQSLVGILQDDTLYSIQVELQADCLAGVWAADADSRGLMEQGDFNEAIVALFNVGDPRGTQFFDPQAHGRAGDRINSFQDGFEGGIEACSLD